MYIILEETPIMLMILPGDMMAEKITMAAESMTSASRSAARGMTSADGGENVCVIIPIDVALPSPNSQTVPTATYSSQSHIPVQTACID